MKCGALLKKEVRGKKYPKLKIVRWVSRANVVRGWKEPTDGYEVCDGNVRADVSIDSECDWKNGDIINSWIDTTYRCDKCGITDFPELKSLDISDIVNKYLDGLP